MSVQEMMDEHYASMPKLGDDERCSKCGALNPLMKFMPGGYSAFTGHTSRDLLALTCFRCGNTWDRRPLDAQGPESIPAPGFDSAEDQRCR